MQYTKIILSAAMLAMAVPALAQEEKPVNEKKSYEVSIDGDGVYIGTSREKEEKKDKAFRITFAMLDIGVNTLVDKTNYGSTITKQQLNVSPELQNENLFSLRTGKSINVNVWPVMAKLRVLKGDAQKIYISTGVGLQMYNFRFNKDISHLNITTPEVIVDSVNFSKNKLGFTYLSVPLNFTFKTKLAEKAWLVYGVGVTGGYRISSWTKQISDERGKQKNHDDFMFQKFNSCISGEIGLDGYFRLYATYQVTPLQTEGLAQHPLCIGIRFGGI